MKPKLPIIIFFVFVSILAFAQQTNDTSVPDIVPPTPTAFEMTRFEAQQPNLYTGKANVSVPLHTIDFDGWQLPLSLSYNSGGIMPSQEASEVGLGWSLNATAVISRTVRSGDDLSEILNAEGYVYDTENYLDLFENSSANWNNLTPTQRASYFQIFKYGQNDTEPDSYNYSFFGFSGSFALSKISGGVVDVVKLAEDGVIVDFDEANKNFTLTTPTGFIGYFTVTERSTNLSGTWANGDNPKNLAGLEVYSTLPSGGYFDILATTNMGNFRPVTAWYLEKIVSPNGKEIFFNYTKSGTADSQYVSISSPSFSESLRKITNPNTLTNYSFSRAVHEHVYQTSISVPNEFTVSFSMEDREDIAANNLYNTGGAFPTSTATYLRRYTQISIIGQNENSTYSKQIDFDQSYFNGDYLTSTSTEDYHKHQMLRSRLDGVTIDDQTYQFQYQLGLNGLPQKSSIGLDHFGYYNGKDSNDYLAPVNVGWPLVQGYLAIDCTAADQAPTNNFYFYHPNRQPDMAYGIMGSLDKVVYPTGGSSIFTYEPHRFYSGDDTTFSSTARQLDFAINSSGATGSIDAGGLRIQKIETKDANNVLISSKSYSYEEGQSTQSSGVLMMPFVHIASSFELLDDPNYCRYHFNYTKSLSGQNYAQGATIGYTRVVETTHGHNEQYTREYRFENVPTELGEFQSYLNSQNYKNGSLEFELARNTTGTNVYSMMNTYDEVVNDSIKGLGISYEVFADPNIGTELTIFKYYPYKIDAVNYNNIQMTRKTFFPSNSVDVTSDYVYDAIAQVQEESQANSSGQTLKTIRKRVNDYIHVAPYTIATDGSGEEMHTALIDRNLVSNVLEEISYENNEVVSAMGYKYDVEHGNVVLREVYVYDRSYGPFVGSTNGFEFSTDYRLRITYDDYDTEGNLLQYTIKDDVPTSFIWGYNDEYPIVRGQGISYSNLLTAHNNAGPNSANYEQDLRNADALITTYAYDPMIGTTKITDERGVSTSYTYDSFRRLKEVKDLNLDLVQVLQYNFRNVNSSGTTGNVGGLTLDASVDFGTIAANSSGNQSLRVENTGNYDVIITDINLTAYFNSSLESMLTFAPLTLKPGDTYNIPITFSSLGTALGVVNGQISIISNDINGTQTAQLTALSEDPFSTLILPSNPNFVINTEFGTVYMVLKNGGNTPLYVRNIISDDTCITNSWSDIVYDANLNTVWYEIPPGSLGVTIPIQLTCPLNTNGNWDGYANLNVIYLNTSTGLLETSNPISVTRYP